MSSIPLAALDVKPIQQPEGPLDQYAKLQSLLGMQQQRQANSLAIQQQQQQLKNTQAMTAAMKDWDGKDYGALAKGVLANGGDANAALQIQQHGLQLRDTASQIASRDATTGQTNIDTIIKKHDQILGALESAKDVPDDQLGQHITSAVQQLQQEGMLTDPGISQKAMQIAQLPPDQARVQLDNFEKSLKGQKDIFEQAQEAAKTKTSQEQADIEQQKLTATLPGGALEDPEKKFLRLNSAQQQGQQLSPADAAFVKSYEKNKTMVPQFNLNMGGGLTPEALDQAATQYLKTGILPSVGFGATGTVLRENIANRAAELARENPDLADLASNKANYAANENSLKNVQKQFDQVNAFENTAGKNLDLFLKTAKGVVDSGSPLVNTPLRLVSDKLAGSQNMAAFNAARVTALTEIAKVLNSSNASGVLSDSARSEVSQLIGKDATLGQIYKAAGILKQDMDNRHDAYQQQISDIQGRISKANKQTGSSQPGTAPQGSAASKIHANLSDFTHQYSGSKGTIYSDDGKTWYDSNGNLIGK